MMVQGGGFHFDWTITLGNVVTFISASIVATVAWMDLRWRVRNLETWRGEHMIDSDSRDNLLSSMKEILNRLAWVEDHRKQLGPWDGIERRR